MEEEKLTRDEAVEMEPDFLAALAAEAANPETFDFVITRRGKKIGKFTVHAVHETEINDCREEATTYERNRNGIRVPKSHDATRYRNLVIYTATAGTKGKKVWDRPEFWQQFGVTNSADLIDQLLAAGEKDRVVDKITELSGFVDDAELENLAKNS